jgi:hypothetical protein
LNPLGLNAGKDAISASVEKAIKRCLQRSGKKMFRNRSTKIFALFLTLIAVAAPMALAEKGSANFNLREKTIFAGTEVKPGAYHMEWEINNANATVTLKTKEGQKVATFQAKVEQIENKNEWNSLVNGKNASGQEAVTGINVGGKTGINVGGKKIRLNFE